MNAIWTTAFYGLLSGTVGTTAGGLLACFLPAEGKRQGAFILEYSAGLMLVVVCLDLLPGAFTYASVWHVLWGLLLGVLIMILSESLLKSHKSLSAGVPSRQTGLAIALGVALHNFPEGLAVGAGLEADPALGMALALAIMLHDIPEGAAIAIPLQNGGVSRWKALWYTIASGLPMGLGALVGAWAGQLSSTVISLCLAVAGGAMLYVVLGNMLPETFRMRAGHMNPVGLLLGILSGTAIILLL